MALRVGYEKLHRETGWAPSVSWEEGVLRTIRWYAANRERWVGRVDWLTPSASPAERAMTDRLRGWSLGHVGVVFLFVACTFTYYGQLHRTQSGDVYGTVYTAVALVAEAHDLAGLLPAVHPAALGRASVHADDELGRSRRHRDADRVERARGAGRRVVHARGRGRERFGAWMEAGMLTAALAAAATVALSSCS